MKKGVFVHPSLSGRLSFWDKKSNGLQPQKKNILTYRGSHANQHQSVDMQPQSLNHLLELGWYLRTGNICDSNRHSSSPLLLTVEVMWRCSEQISYDSGDYILWFLPFGKFSGLLIRCELNLLSSTVGLQPPISGNFEERDCGLSPPQSGRLKFLLETKVQWHPLVCFNVSFHESQPI